MGDEGSGLRPAILYNRHQVTAHLPDGRSESSYVRFVAMTARRETRGGHGEAPVAQNKRRPKDVLEDFSWSTVRPYLTILTIFMYPPFN